MIALVGPSGGADLSGGELQRISIAHHLNTIRNADKILVVKDGQIAESGTHNELITKGGKYAMMIKR